MGHREGRFAAFRRDNGGALEDTQGASGRDLALVVHEQRQVAIVDVRAAAEGRGEVKGAVGHSGSCVREAQSIGRDVAVRNLEDRGEVVQYELKIEAGLGGHAGGCCRESGGRRENGCKLRAAEVSDGDRLVRR